MKDDLAEAHRLALKRYHRAAEYDEDNRDAAYDDLEFMIGEQWSEEDRRAREGRPCLTINYVRQFVKQVAGDIRMSKPGINVLPVDSGADVQVADILSGLIRNIEASSDAKAAYAAAVDSQVAAGVGHWRVSWDYAEHDGFSQELRIEPIEDGVGVLWDPAAKRLTRSDARFCFVPYEMERDDFKEAYPDAAVAPLDDDQAVKSAWFGDRYRVAEYWCKKPYVRKLALLDDGSTTDADAIPPGRIAVKVDERESYRVVRYIMSGAEIIDGPMEIPGQYIPIIPVIGEEVRAQGRTYRSGLIRFAKDPQRRFNYWASAQTEAVALQPKAPWLVTSENIAEYQDVWHQANLKNLPFLPYTPDAGNGGAPPQRATPPVASAGIAEGLALAAEDMKRVTGIYDASLGARSNETSGKAILARQREGDVANFVYLDNFARAIRHTADVLIGLIPHFYDTARIVRIMGEDGAIQTAEINKPTIADGAATVLNDLSVGRYDVAVEAGSSYASRRQEAAEGMMQFMQAVPAVAPMMLPDLAKMQDWPDADKLAEKLAAMSAPQGPPPPDPKMEIEAAKLQFEREVKAAELDLERQKLVLEARKLEIEAMKVNAGMARDAALSMAPIVS